MGLSETAFLDVGCYIVSAAVLSNFILVADVYKSIYFVRWKAEKLELSLLASDQEACECYAADFLVNGKTLGMVSTDALQNVRVFQYLTKIDVQRLMCTAEFCMRSHVAAISRIAITPTPEQKSRDALLMGAVDGSVSLLCPMEQSLHRRLVALQASMTSSIPHACALNPAEYRAAILPPGNAPFQRLAPLPILDLNFVLLFLTLSTSLQRELARSIGTSPEIIIDNLREISTSASYL